MSAPVGPYSALRRAGDLVVCSGQLGLDPDFEDARLVDGGVREQTRQALSNVGKVFGQAGLGWPDVFKVTAFLADISDYGAFNEVYAEALAGNRPARSVVAVSGLPLGALVEVEAWAHFQAR